MSAFDRIFVDVDTQFDFMDLTGKLYVPGAEELVGPLEKLFTYAARAEIPVLSSVDEHAPDDPEFQQWPPHCIRGTQGQQKLPITLMARHLMLRADEPLPEEPIALLSRYRQLIFPKPTLDAFDHPHFAAIVEALPNSDFFVFGVATDYCVRLAARGLLERDRHVKVVSDAVRGITAETEMRTREELTSLGAEWVTTADVV